MDNDDLRRGMPTSHKKFGEAAAILAGDGLLSYAFELLTLPELTATLSPADQARIVHLIAKAIGPLGMVGGQALDLDAEGKAIPFEALRRIHRCKTGALITASVQAGAIGGQADPQQFAALSSYGEHLGLAFQIVDDLLNVEGTTEQLGKAAGSDATYPAFFGLAGTREMAMEAVDAAIASLSDFDQRADFLRELARYIYTRTT
jgi:geranylgeranyl diphosphate synthase type II